MKLICDVVIVLLLFFGPRLMLLLSNRFRLLGLMGPVFLCYALGILFSFILPEKGLAMTASELLVPVAIPLILFSADLRSVKRLAKPTLISFLLVIVSVFAVAVLSFFLFRGIVNNADKYAGMIIGLYTGGTPNLIAIGMALGVDNANIVLANTVDMVVGGIYFLMLISFLPGLVRRFLPRFTAAEGEDELLSATIRESFVPKKEAFQLQTLRKRLPALGAALLSLGLAAGLALLLTGELNVMVIMLVVTTCGVIGSFIKRIRETPGSFSAGQYLIYMFSLGIGLSFDLTQIDAGMFAFLAMFATAQFGAAVLHLLLSRLAHIDADTALITSTAGIFGPAFIVPVSDALKNRQVTLPGLICGILGYAVGNYLGIGTAVLLGLF